MSVVITQTELWSAIDAAIALSRPQRPEGSITPTEYAKKHGLAKSTARDRLSKAASIGVLECQRIMIDGRAATFYWPKKLTAKTKR